jgi:hypothetical protein
MTGSRAWPRWRFAFTPKWLAWHVFVVAAVAGMLMLGDWQWHRAAAGNALSWAYTFEWPVFAVFAVVFWVKTLRDEAALPGPGTPGSENLALPDGVIPAAGGTAPATPGEDGEEEELAAYNAYLARLHQEVKGHGRWHGLR